MDVAGFKADAEVADPELSGAVTVLLEIVDTPPVFAGMLAVNAVECEELPADAEEGVEPGDEKKMLCELPVAMGVEKVDAVPPPVALPTTVDAVIVKELTGSPASEQESSRSI